LIARYGVETKKPKNPASDDPYGEAVRASSGHIGGRTGAVLADQAVLHNTNEAFIELNN
jgi:hypothetical protein